MSKYTTEVRYICESYAGLSESVGCDDVEETIELAKPKIFNFNYPIFDEAYRQILETKILRHYYTREIAHETVGLWRLKLNTKMNEIMPYFNQLYKSELLVFNPLYDVDVKRDKSNTNNGTKKTVGTTIQGVIKKDTGTVVVSDTLLNTGTVKNAGTIKDTGTIGDINTRTDNLSDVSHIVGTDTKTLVGDNKDAYSDTPQGSLEGVENNQYLTNFRKVSANNTDTDVVDKTDTILKTGTVGNNSTVTNDLTKTNDLTVTNDLTHHRDNTVTNDLTSDTDNTLDVDNLDTINNIETYVETVAGKQGGGTYSEMLLKFRQTFMNIDMKVIDELEELFHHLW